MRNSRYSTFSAVFIFCLLPILLVNCAKLQMPTRSPYIGESGPLGECADFFASLDKKIAEANVIDPGVFRVKNHPYLRVDRFLASFSDEVDDSAAFATWVDRMQALDRDARKYEIANLPSPAAAPGSAIDKSGPNDRVVTCGNMLKAADFQNSKRREKLRNKRAVAQIEFYLLTPPHLVRQIFGFFLKYFYKRTNSN